MVLDKLPVRIQSIEQYKKQSIRSEGDIDLVSWVRSLFDNLGYEAILSQHYDNHPTIIAAKDKGPDLQRFHLNQYWSTQLLSVQVKTGESTMDARSYLTTHGSVSDWMVFFQESVLPAIIHYNLPTEL